MIREAGHILAGIGVWFLLEGAIYAIAPDAMKRFGAWLTEQKLTRQYLPERLEIIDAFPRTPSGKIQKFVLREQARQFAVEKPA